MNTRALRDELISCLASTVAHEHPCENVQGCDVCYALDADYVLHAAALLAARETAPITASIWSALLALDKDIVRELSRELESMFDEERWMCEKCHTVNWTSDYSLPCANTTCLDDAGIETQRAWMKEARQCVGDVNAIEHGGGFVHSCGLLVVLEEPCDNDYQRNAFSTKHRWTVYECNVADMDVSDVDGFNLSDVARFCSTTVDDLRAPFLMETPNHDDEENRMTVLCRRASALSDIAAYVGGEQAYDSSPRRLTRRQVETLFPGM